MSQLRWTSKSTAKLAAELVRQGFKITDDTVGRILRSLGYSLQAPAREKEGTAHPDETPSSPTSTRRCGASS
jgi:transposase